VSYRPAKTALHYPILNACPDLLMIGAGLWTGEAFQKPWFPAPWTNHVPGSEGPSYTLDRGTNQAMVTSHTANNAAAFETVIAQACNDLHFPALRYVIKD